MMNGAITMTDEQWAELRARVQWLMEMAETAPEPGAPDTLRSVQCDLNTLFDLIDDANTRARYMALAAADQLGLFGGGPV